MARLGANWQRPATSALRIMPALVEAKPRPLIGQCTKVAIPIQNPSSSIVLRVDGIELSCTCAEILTRPSQVAVGSRAEVVVAAPGDPFKSADLLSISLITSGAADGITVSVVDIGAEPPFDGWPMCARGRVDSKGVLIVLTTRYMDPGAIRQLRAFRAGTTVEVPTTLGSDGVRVHCPAGDPADLVVDFGGNGQATWSGPIQVARG